MAADFWDRAHTAEARRIMGLGNPCHVVNEGCTAPPRLTESTRARCYACGNRARTVLASLSPDAIEYCVVSSSGTDRITRAQRECIAAGTHEKTTGNLHRYTVRRTKLGEAVDALRSTLREVAP